MFEDVPRHASRRWVWQSRFVAQSTVASSLLFRFVLPASDPRDFATEDVTEVEGSFVDRQLVNRCPQFQLIALTVTFVAGVSSGAQVHGESATTLGH